MFVIGCYQNKNPNLPKSRVFALAKTTETSCGVSPQHPGAFRRLQKRMTGAVRVFVIRLPISFLANTLCKKFSIIYIFKIPSSSSKPLSMRSTVSRRKFLSQAGLTLAGLPFLPTLAVKPTALANGIEFGYSAITWGGNDLQAIKDIAALGFKGIQLRSNILEKYGTNPQEVSDLLKQNKLELAMFSSGNANINTGDDEKVIQSHVNNAKFVKALGGKNIQLTNSSRPKTGLPTPEDLKKYAGLINEIGKRTLDLGIQVNYHNHMGQLGEKPEEVDMILEGCDEKNVKLLLDVAHYHQGGGDPVKAIVKYKGRIKSLHLKDVRPNPAAGANGYTFVELGQGKVALKDCFKALDQISFKGWGIIELDAVPDKAKTPVECGNISKAFLGSLGIKV
jgi:inosose dehydratase